MNEKNTFSNVQRHNSIIMAKYDWTSSLRDMQKSGEEIHARRTKIYQKANKFLQELLQKRSDGSAIDDNDVIDRYHKYLKYKSNFTDDDILNEFNRRLRALNANRRNYSSKISKSTSIGLQTTTENDTIQQLNPDNRSKSLSKLSITSSDDSHMTIILNTDLSSITKSLHKPKARRADGSEIIVISSINPLKHTSSNILLFNQSYFPRSLLSHERINTKTISKRQLPSPPAEQFNNNQLFHLLDQVENKCSNQDFTTILNQLNLSSVVQQQQTDDDPPLINDDENIPILLNPFDQPLLSQDYYQTLNINIEDPTKIIVYTMTIGIVQLTPSLLVPYSILNGRRPLLQCSFQTNFKQVRSKQPHHSSQVTAIESSINVKQLKPNDIILKINDESVWNLTTDAIRNILQKYNKRSDSCLFTIARLCQPLF